MRINILTDNLRPFEEARVGNVYAVRGGRGAKMGHMMILIAIGVAVPYSCQGPMACMLVVNKEGEATGVTSYGMHYVEALCPIAFVEGLEDMELTMRAIL